ncbi:penicillin-binding protein 2 [Paenibacillus sp. FSL H8-0537]|uniref:peptidoglycan D,D-transpeptidase FtsI family protein n=1 Tax=Paenibacillus sp. FSL H8-0537 TaxID=2921399 RepID=UPI0031018AA0
MIRRRAAIVAILLTVIMAGYLIRLATLQLVPSLGQPAAQMLSKHIDWKHKAAIQRQRNLVLDSGRGDFMDRYGRAITGESYSALALFPVESKARGETTELRKLAKLLQVSYEQLVEKWDALKSADFWREEGQKAPLDLSASQLTGLSQLHINGVKVLPYHNRYLPQLNARQAIGFISQHPEWLEQAYGADLASGKRKLTDEIGGAGLEKSLDTLLRGNGPTSVSFYVDGQRHPLQGLGLRVFQPDSAYYPLKVKTTLDVQLQQQLELYADANGLKAGAIVVLDAQNADIVSMVSRPQMNPQQLDRNEETDWSNHALQAVAPGSIFKLVTEAAALEAGVVDEKEVFTCSGQYGKYGLTCWKQDGHGSLTLEEGLAKSCNIVFATLAERLSGYELYQTATALGIGDPSGWHAESAFGPFAGRLRLLGEEEGGQLFAASIWQQLQDKPTLDVDGGIMAQSGIGQRDVRMTPLQAANLVVTILHGGQRLEPRIVSEIRYANGQLMVELKPRQARQAGTPIHARTAGTLLEGMKAVTEYGTGRSIRDGIWPVAGKSGTAQTLLSGKERVHQWFIGYGPTNTPRYAVAVLAENRSPGTSNQATKLFRGVMDIIAKR